MAIEVLIEGILEEIGRREVVSFVKAEGVELPPDSDGIMVVNFKRRLRIKTENDSQDFYFPGNVAKSVIGHNVQVYHENGNDDVYYLRDLFTNNMFTGSDP